MLFGCVLFSSFYKGIIFHGMKSQLSKTELKLAFYTLKQGQMEGQRQRAERERKEEQHNLCSDGDYVPQKQMIKASRKRSMSVSLLRRMLHERSERTLVQFGLLRERNIESSSGQLFCNPNFFSRSFLPIRGRIIL